MGNFDPFAFTSGLIDDFDLEITEADFVYNSRIDKTGETLFLRLQGKTDSPEQPVLDEETAIHISCGRKFTTEDGGKTSIHESGRQQAYNKSTHLAEFLVRAVGLNAAVRTEINPYDGSTWVGSKWHLKREQVPSKMEEGKFSEKLMPVAYLGKGNSTSGSADSQGAHSADVAPAPVSASQNNGNESLPREIASDSDLVARLSAVALDSVDVDAFQTTALSIVGLSDDVQVALVDPDYANRVYAALKG